MSDLDRIIEVNITKQESTITIEAFNDLLIVGIHKVFHERLRAYSTLQEMADDGFSSSFLEYKAAEDFLAQPVHPDKFYIGRRSVDDIVVTVDTAIDVTSYTVKINASVYEYVSGVGATALSIAAGIVAVINGDVNAIVAAIDNLDGTYQINAKVTDTAYTATLDENQSIGTLAASANIDDDMDAIKNESNEWYGVIETSRVKADVETLITWIEANEKLFITASNDTNIIDVAAASDTTSLAYFIKNGSYERSSVIYHADLTEFPEAAWFANGFSADPGTITWAFKNLAGIQADNLSTTQIKNAIDKKANIYTATGGANITQFGSNGVDFIDITRAIDWLKARIQEAVYGLLVSTPKVPYSDSGIATIESKIKLVLSEGVQKDVFLGDPAPTTEVPRRAKTNPADRAARILRDVKFVCYLAGAIHSVKINGTVII